ncbi:hypothetical protein QWZ02_03925 [Kinneretia asaccharophila]|uniref:Uncharacterized protein n=1 Tax=Roseateles asaccharophilus TaxID=582607 RepID=A0A4R6N9F0_9BURK|nr:hypothetical protein [Roseateles asaccharophilus]MDN3543596.1 hypothetical protein [Roseateles asaccharophilus]TDP12028.1 hypothetical protein DFR39_102416 [Roseateles asaccharophilus]
MLSALASFALRLLLAVATVVLVLALMGVALLTLLGLTIWSLIRGRKPVLDLSGFARARQFRAGAGVGGGGAFGRRAPAGEVVDVEVREVKPEQARLEP